MILGLQAVKLAAFPVNAGNKKICQNGGNLFVFDTQQIDDSVSLFYFHEFFLSSIYIFFYLTLFHSQYSSHQDDSHLEQGDGEDNEKNFFLYTDPGIYQITCNTNGKVYIGEAKNLLDRINKHYKDLENGISDCYEMQKDWKSYGKFCFSAKILLKGEIFSTKENRLLKENEIIKFYKPEQVYNVPPERVLLAEDNYRIICEIQGQIFGSISQASKNLKISENSLRRRLFNNTPGYLVMDKVRQGYEPIIANGKLYDSIMDCVRAGEAKNRFQATRFLKNKSLTNWNYLNVAKRLEKN